jgi:peptidoglycan hydrolase CwlO-like protein
MDFNVESTIQVLGLVALAVVTAFVGIQQMFKNWRSTSAETSVITLMHTELERMSAQNAQLSTELGRLHTEIITLNNELQKLSLENNRLQVEVCALTEEVSKFRERDRQETGY